MFEKYARNYFKAKYSKKNYALDSIPQSELDTIRYLIIERIKRNELEIMRKNNGKTHPKTSSFLRNDLPYFEKQGKSLCSLMCTVVRLGKIEMDYDRGYFLTPDVNGTMIPRLNREISPEEKEAEDVPVIWEFHKFVDGWLFYAKFSIKEDGRILYSFHLDIKENKKAGR